MKIFVNGAAGQLGQEVLSRFSQSDDVRGFSRDEWDVTDGERTRDLLQCERPDVVIHCAAYTHVDRAEDEPIVAYRVNAYGARNVAASCREIGAVMVYVSTDYVFGGERKGGGYDEWDQPAPLNVYGRSKEAGEQLVRQFCPEHFILRTSWLYGVHGHNFFKAIVDKGRTVSRIPVVNDQTGSPTYAGHLVSTIKELIATRCYGTFHTANSGACTWYQFAKEIARQMLLKAQIVPTTSSQFGQKARRPRYSVLSSVSLPAQNVAPLPHWREGVREMSKQWKEDTRD